MPSFGVASAQTSTDERVREARRDLLDQAQAARTRGDHQQALSLALRAIEIQSSPSLRLFAAGEQAALGRWAASFANARLCRNEAERDTTLRNRDEIIAVCTRMSTEAGPHVGYVSVSMPPESDALTLRVGDALLPRVLWGRPFVVDAGNTSITIERDGASIFSEQVNVAPGETTPVMISPQSLRRPVAANTDRHPRSEGHSTVTTSPSIAPWVVFGSGVAVAAVGAVLYGVSYTMVSCPTASGVCDTQTDAAMVEARAAPIAITGDTLMIAGGVAAAAGLLWALLAPRPAERARAMNRDAHGDRARGTELRCQSGPSLEAAPLGLRVRF